MKTHPSLSLTAVALCAIGLGSNVKAQSVTDWHTFKNTATTLSGQGTDDPILGSLANSSSTAFLIGYLNAPLSLVNVGDKISLTFSMTFNDTAGMAAGANDNLRFALFDLNGESKVTIDNTATAGTTDTDNLRGYWYGVRTSPTGGSIRKRISSDANPFANSSNTLLGTPGGSAVTFSGAVNGVGGQAYSGELTITKTALGIDLSGYFGGNATTNTFAISDNSSPFSSNFEAVGFLNGSAVNVDQILFQDVSVTLTPVPEPSSILLAFAGATGLFGYRFFRSRARKTGV